jgi:hypothetical protein
MAKIKKVVQQLKRLGSLPPKLIFHVGQTPLDVASDRASTKEVRPFVNVRSTATPFNSDVLEDDTFVPFQENHPRYRDSVTAACDVVAAMCRYNKPWDD